MIETKTVQRFGNSGHVVLPKIYVGKRIRFVLGPKPFEDIKFEVLGILRQYLENILGIYLYGSYARNEQAIDSDVDILVVTGTKLKIIEKINNFSIVSATITELESILDNNAILLLPILKEAKTIINPSLLEKYKKNKFTSKNTRPFIDNTDYALKLNEKGLSLNFETGSLVYSLILRTRGLLMIKLISNNKLYSKASLFSCLRSYGFSQSKVEEFYRIYSKERDGIRVIESRIVTKKDILKLLSAAEDLLKEIRSALA